ncbi:hypothetical protein NDU88_004725 [Pleurodeles waltl]|uniref:Uncharacterized protein n=1 Tax=Pleurodeles waltl TaxID=8319 RepID=A0AAV7LML5_PLEWA|nr:hypothetical protein NDU88_004725 [Pleurodeles waltl]
MSTETPALQTDPEGLQRLTRPFAVRHKGFLLSSCFPTPGRKTPLFFTQPMSAPQVAAGRDPLKERRFRAGMLDFSHVMGSHTDRLASGRVVHRGVRQSRVMLRSLDAIGEGSEPAAYLA